MWIENASPNTYLATYPPVGPAAPIPAGGGPLPPTPPSSPPFQIASSSLNSLDLKCKRLKSYY